MHKKCTEIWFIGGHQQDTHTWKELISGDDGTIVNIIEFQISL
jgi:hypothetical protein